MVSEQDCNTPLAIPFSELRNSVLLPDKRPFPSDLQSIGDHIKYYRLQNNIPIKNIVDNLLIDRDTLRGWELNLFQPFVKHYPKIIQLLGYYPFEYEEETLGGKIKKYRFTKGLTQRQFAKLMQTDATTIWQWESNSRLPLPKTQKTILRLIDLE